MKLKTCPSLYSCHRSLRASRSKGVGARQIRLPRPPGRSHLWAPAFLSLVLAHWMQSDAKGFAIHRKLTDPRRRAHVADIREAEKKPRGICASGPPNRNV